MARDEAACETLEDIYARQAREDVAAWEAQKAAARRLGLVETITGPEWEPKIRRFLACGFTRREAQEVLATLKLKPED